MNPFVVLIVLYSFVPFHYFDTETEQEIFDEVLHGDLDFTLDPWPSISDSAKDLVQKMLVRNPRERLTAHEVLCKFLLCEGSFFYQLEWRWLENPLV